MAQVPPSQPRPEFPDVPLSEGYVTRRDQLGTKAEQQAKGKGKGKGNGKGKGKGKKAKNTGGDDQDQGEPGLEAPKPKKTAAKSKGQKPQKPETGAHEAGPKRKLRRTSKHIMADDVKFLEEEVGTPAPSPSTEGPTQAAEVELQCQEEGDAAEPKASRKRKVKKDSKVKEKQAKAKGKAKVAAAAKGKAKTVSTKDVPQEKAKPSRRKCRKAAGGTGEEGDEGEHGAGRDAHAPSAPAPIARRRGRPATAGNGGEDGGGIFFCPSNPLHEALVQDILTCLHLCKHSGECGKKGKHCHEIPKLDMDGAHDRAGGELPKVGVAVAYHTFQKMQLHTVRQWGKSYK